MKHPVKGIIFDLDGTLLNTLADIAAAENKVLAELGLPTRAVDEYRWIVGGGAESLAQKLLPDYLHTEKDINCFVERFRYFYHRNWHDQTELYEGVEELLKKLLKMNVKLAVLSNKPEEFALKLVDYFFPGWQNNSPTPVFTHVIGQRKGSPTKPDPVTALKIAVDWKLSPDKICLLGDSDLDIITARRAQMLSAGAEWGFRGREELAAEGADILLTHPLDLLNYIE